MTDPFAHTVGLVLALTTFLRQVAKMEENAATLERRAMEIEALMQRSVGASTLQNTDTLSLADSDPLLEKFKDLGID